MQSGLIPDWVKSVMRDVAERALGLVKSGESLVSMALVLVLGSGKEGKALYVELRYKDEVGMRRVMKRVQDLAQGVSASAVVVMLDGRIWNLESDEGLAKVRAEELKIDLETGRVVADDSMAKRCIFVLARMFNDQCVSVATAYEWVEGQLKVYPPVEVGAHQVLEFIKPWSN